MIRCGVSEAKSVQSATFQMSVARIYRHLVCESTMRFRCGRQVRGGRFLVPYVERK